MIFSESSKGTHTAPDEILKLTYIHFMFCLYIPYYKVKVTQIYSTLSALAIMHLCKVGRNPLNPYKSIVLFVGHRHKVQTKIWRHKTFAQRMLYKSLNENEKYHQTSLKFEIDSSYR